MKRREFIKISGAGLIAGAAGSAFSGPLAFPGKSDLDYHRIADIRFSTLSLRYKRPLGKSARFEARGDNIEEAIHILYTDKGASGWGLSRGSRESLESLFSLIRGKRVSDLIDPSAGVISPLNEAFDFSLFDLAGNILRKPVYRLLGKKKPEICVCSSIICFDDLEPSGNPSGIKKIMEECHSDFELGYRQLKIKTGRGFRWMEKDEGLKRDIEITRQVIEAFPGCNVLIDADKSFTSESFLSYLESCGPLALFWIEEPFPETIIDYARLSSWLKVHNQHPYLAAGKTDPDEQVLQSLESQRVINVAVEDLLATGFSAWIKKIRLLKLRGIQASPATRGSAIRSNYTAHLAGAFATIPSIETAGCYSDDVDLGGYALDNGRLIPSAAPGFGMKVLRKI